MNKSTTVRKTIVYLLTLMHTILYSMTFKTKPSPKNYVLLKGIVINTILFYFYSQLLFYFRDNLIGF